MNRADGPTQSKALGIEIDNTSADPTASQSPPALAAHANAPEVSGGAGFTFADRTAAVYLAALLGRQQAPGLPERRVIRVALEQANFGEPLDDLIVDGISIDGSTARLSLQVKRELTVSAAVSNTDFRKIVWCAAKTLRKPNFREGIDRVGTATGTIAARSKRALTEVSEIARESTSELRFFQCFDVGGSAGQGRREIVKAFRTILAQSPCGAAGDDVVYRVLRHFVVIEFDSMHEGATADPVEPSPCYRPRRRWPFS